MEYGERGRKAKRLKNCNMDLTGKWKYKERYEFGRADGELFLEQEGNQLSGKIVLMDRPKKGKAYMLQEKIRGEVVEHKVRLHTYNVDIIYSEEEIVYMPDYWFGILVDDNTIAAASVDEQEVEGDCMFERVIE